MARAELLVPADPEVVWATLTDPHTYPQWLAGCKHMRDVDDHWPAVGSAFHHRVGFGPLTFDDRSWVLAVEARRRLVLQVRATFAIQAVVTFELRPADGGTLVSFEEEPAHRLIGNIVRPVMDPLTHVRNKASLQQLAQVVAERPRSGA
jgi:uncharacterized protein YndB with AHSA1/START domain